MRAVILASLAFLLAISMLEPPRQASAEDATAKPPATRVNTLSPDEARRAARARERAARLAKPAPVAAKAQPAEKPAAQVAVAPPKARPTRTAEDRPSAPAVTHHAHRSYRSRHTYAYGSGRAPRVGDYVGPDVALRPLPPGYAYGGDDSDDARTSRAAPRRAYATPYPGAPPYPRVYYGDVEQ